ncbi:hypothetical protein MGYG_02382 [Nannizzia gypsea CBS 118893]|uniref:Uncharacterized protein n=1 Tax=Arthroderma gypseum (strain ATCC MYA-4604 / CBS 118893) TaxID=535722 RepID=E4URE9_ARTGP|nr:hypothetical protein MGYG_02382 [Nannizzia gypsea CBS 118893]EFQ99371.1 hypothetical protein MGYG_02382 [Nannizzia gypsea CBS 118893]
MSIFSRRSNLANNKDNKVSSSASSIMSTSSVSSIAALKAALRRQRENNSELSKKAARKQITCISPTTSEAARASYFAHRAGYKSVRDQLSIMARDAEALFKERWEEEKHKRGAAVEAETGKGKKPKL